MEPVQSVPPTAHRARRRYDWEKLLDGQLWKLTKGEDFGSADSVRMATLAAASVRGLRVKVSIAREGQRRVRASHPGERQRPHLTARAS